MVDYFVPGPRQNLSQPAHVRLDHVGRDWLFHVAIEFGMQPIVLNNTAAVLEQQSEQPPESGCQATWFAGDKHDTPSAVDVAGFVEIVGERNLLTTSIAKRQRLTTAL
jgi:hypothetical protein